MAKTTNRRATWKGNISFGLVNIPVAVYPATREEKVSFRQLRASDMSPIKYKKVAETDGKEVPADQIIKGYEYERGRFVTMRDDELSKVRLKSTHSIDILDFVDLTKVDPKFFRKPYFLEPQKGGEKAYALLRKALAETGRIGIAKVVLSNRQYLTAVRADGKALVLELLHFEDEVLQLPEDTIPDVETKPAELMMAKALVDGMQAEWDPSKYLDEYRDAVLELIDRKIKGEVLELEPPVDRKVDDDGDILKTLQASLALRDKK